MSSSNDEYRRQESLNVFITNVKFLKAPHKQALPVSATHLRPFWKAKEIKTKHADKLDTGGSHIATQEAEIRGTEI
jgi:hypothetical protein